MIDEYNKTVRACKFIQKFFVIDFNFQLPFNELI